MLLLGLGEIKHAISVEAKKFKVYLLGSILGKREVVVFSLCWMA